MLILSRRHENETAPAQVGRALLTLLVIAGLTAGIFSVPVAALAAPPAQQSNGSCAPGASPAFQNGFAWLKSQVGPAMGDPTTCEYYDASGNAYQQTTTGFAFWNRSTNTPVFTRGDEHWAWTAAGLQHWTGQSNMNPPANAGAAPGNSQAGAAATQGEGNPPQTLPQTGTSDVNWRYYGNDLGNMRYQNLDQINPGNVSQLQPAWIFHTGVSSKETSFESQPIVIDGTTYVSSPHGHVFALDAATGSLKWTYNPQMPSLDELAICCGQTNRGVAVGDGKVFVGLLDATLAAVDQQTGKELWHVAVGDYHQKQTETMAPQYYNGKVIVGISGGEFEVRGRVTAYDANSGKEVWRFYTAPGPGQVGNNTWAGNSWKNGGAPVWTTPAVDPQLGLIYVTTGNAADDLNGSQRAGMNLFTASIVALDANTGQYRWHFQEVHHDIWDFDGPQPAQLFTLDRNGQQIPALAHCNKNGNYFILDRRNGQPLYDVKETPVPQGPKWQNAWPTQPMPATDPLIPQSVLTPTQKFPWPSAPLFTPPGEQPMVIQPGLETGCEWPGAAYSPRTHYSYIAAGGYEPWVVRSVPNILDTPGSLMSDKTSKPSDQHFGLFDAVDTTTGKIAWKIQVPNRTASSPTVAGDLVFLGQSNGKFNAVDARSGKVLWSYKSGDQGVGGANGQPAVYTVNGREYVAMAFGGNTQVRNTEDSPTGDALIAFALPQGQGGQSQPNTVTANPQQVPTGEIPDSNLSPAASSAPQGAHVVELQVHDFRFYPAAFMVQPGQRVAVHVKNTDPIAGYDFTIKLPTGTVGLKETIEGGKDGYFVFSAPTQPGHYEFFSRSEEGKFKGATGTVIVGNQLPANPASLVPQNVQGAAADLKGQNGQSLGFATLFPEAASGVRIHVEATGFDTGSGGNHALAIQTGGQCTFASAAGSSASGSQSNRLPDAQFDPDGTVNYTTVLPSASLNSGSGALLGQQGNTLVVFAGPGDNPGQVIACGSINAMSGQ